MWSAGSICGRERIGRNVDLYMCETAGFFMASYIMDGLLEVLT
jgi:hypothetical protein